MKNQKILYSEVAIDYTPSNTAHSISHFSVVKNRLYSHTFCFSNLN